MVQSLPSGAWSPEDAAAVIGCTPDHVRWLCREGRLVAALRARRWYVDPDSVRRYVARRAQVQLEGMFK
jgi:Helix-turn-helix domain